MVDTNKISQLGKSNLRIIINSVYGATGTDNYWYDWYRKYVLCERRKKKIKSLLNS